MRIDVSSCEGSADLIKPLQKLGLEVRPRTLAQLPFSDIAFTGNGAAGPVAVGIEFKTLSELLSAVQSGKFVGHQLRGMVKRFPVRYLLFEGKWGIDPRSGILQVPRHDRRGRTIWVDAGYGARRWSYAALIEWLNGLPLRWLRTGSRTETLHAIFGLAAWWDKPFHKHTALKVIYNGMSSGRALAGQLDDEFVPLHAAMTDISHTRRILADVPHVGWEFSAAAEEAFGSVAVASMADWRAWARLRADGLTAGGRRRPRLGATRAKAAVAALRNT